MHRKFSARSSSLPGCGVVFFISFHRGGVCATGCVRRQTNKIVLLTHSEWPSNAWSNVANMPTEFFMQIVYLSPPRMPLHISRQDTHAHFPRTTMSMHFCPPPKSPTKLATANCQLPDATATCLTSCPSSAPPSPLIFRRRTRLARLCPASCQFQFETMSRGAKKVQLLSC